MKYNLLHRDVDHDKNEFGNAFVSDDNSKKITISRCQSYGH
jgi:hypothetical protein